MLEGLDLAVDLCLYLAVPSEVQQLEDLPLEHWLEVQRVGDCFHRSLMEVVGVDWVLEAYLEDELGLH